MCGLPVLEKQKEDREPTVGSFNPGGSEGLAKDGGYIKEAASPSKIFLRAGPRW